MIPMRDGVRLFTILYLPATRRARIPFLLNRDAYGVAPTAPDNYRRGPALRRVQPGKGSSSSTRTFADGGSRKASSSITCRSFLDRTSPTRAPTRSTQSRGCIANVPNNNGRVSQRGVSWTGWETAMGMIRAHPALKLSSPQAPPRGSVLRRRLSFRRGVSARVRLRLDGGERARRPGRAKSGHAVRFPTPDGYRFFLSLGAAGNAKRLRRRCARPTTI